MLFQAGVLWRLYDSGLLREVDGLASVSTAAVTAAALGSAWSRLSLDPAETERDFVPLVVRPLRRLAGQTADRRMAMGGLHLPSEAGTHLAGVYRRQLLGEVALDDLPVPPASSPEQPARLMLADVEKALHRLSDEQRQALLLVALEGFGYAEAARILGIPVGTLMSRLGRARENLRRLTDEAATPTLRRVK